MKKTLLTLITILFIAVGYSQNAVLLKNESIEISDSIFTTKNKAKSYFDFFSNSDTFKWKEDLENNCEDRANAVSILLDEWGIPNYKVWIFNSSFLNKGKSKLCGDCPNSICWGFHVATIIPYKENNKVKHIVIDPATLNSSNNISFWAKNITCSGTNYYLITDGNKYIWSKKGAEFSKETFWVRNEKNFKWTMQGLAGINGKSIGGKMSLLFGNKEVKKTKKKFNYLLKNNPIK